MEVRGFISTIFPDLVFFGSYTLYDIIIYSVYAHLPELAFIRIALEGGEGDGHFTGKEFALFYKSLCFETSRSPEREVSSIKSHFVIKEIPAGVYFKAVVADILWKRIDKYFYNIIQTYIIPVFAFKEADIYIVGQKPDI